MTVRRAVLAGALTAVGVAALLLPVDLAGTGRASPLVVFVGLTVGALVTTAWLLLATVLDVFAGHRIGLRRALWTAVATLVALLSPFLLVAAIATG